MAARISPGRLRLGYYRAHFLESIRPDGIVCLVLPPRQRRRLVDRQRILALRREGL